MTKEIRLKLIELARLRTTWTYSQLDDFLQLGLDFSLEYHRQLIGEWLGEISIHEHRKGRPLLSSLITHKNGKREQGDGFYKLCEGSNKKWENGLIADCYTFWLNTDNYKKYKEDF